MENMSFDKDCRKRVTEILSGKISSTEAIAELDKKYGVSKVKCRRSIKGQSMTIAVCRRW